MVTTGKVAEIRLLLKNDGSTREVTWATDVGNTIKYDNDFPHKSFNSRQRYCKALTIAKPMVFDLLLMAVQLFTRNTLEYFNVTFEDDLIRHK